MLAAVGILALKVCNIGNVAVIAKVGQGRANKRLRDVPSSSIVEPWDRWTITLQSPYSPLQSQKAWWDGKEIRGRKGIYLRYTRKTGVNI
jgi:hypothetical protein